MNKFSSKIITDQNDYVRRWKNYKVWSLRKFKRTTRNWLLAASCLFLIVIISYYFNFEILVAVLSVVWFLVLSFSIILLFSYQYVVNSYERDLKNCVKKSNHEYVLEFDEDKITFYDHRFRTELNWSYYETYFINGIDLYFFSLEKYPHIFSRNDVGEQAFNRLLILCNEKKIKLLTE